MKNRYVSELMTIPRKSLIASSKRTMMTTRTIERGDGDDETNDTRWMSSDFSPRMFSLDSSISSSFLSLSSFTISRLARSSVRRARSGIREHRPAVGFRVVLHVESFVQAFKFGLHEWKVVADDDGFPFIG